MASRRAVPPSLWSGHERLRIGERLQASLAGLWELDLLREMQKANVESALTGSEPTRSSEDPNGFGSGKLTRPNGAKPDQSKAGSVAGYGEERCGLYASSENMELCVHAEDGADKEGLGLRMMGEESKKVGLSGGDTSEVLEADSRPSSGFYETSEMGSLSDSCASVHSDGPGASRCSIGSLPHLPGLRENGFLRPRSTDEAAVRLLDLQLQRLTLASVAGTDSRRPVSTGDLEFLLGLGSLPLPRPPNFHLLRYKSDLVSRNTNEVYHYPSPLHAVALQSPLFTNSLSQSSSQEDLDEMPPKVPGTDSPKRDPLCSGELPRIRLDQYVAKLVLRYKCRTAASRTESGYLAGNQKSLSMTSVCSSGAVAGQVLGPVPGWKIRRRISTCSHLRSPEGSEGARDSRVLDGFLWDFPPFPEINSFQSSTTNLVRPSESSVMSLPTPQDPSVKLVLNKPSATLDRNIWAAGPHQLMIKTESPFRKETSLPRAVTGVDKLYKGKHASRELVKTLERGEKAAERSWLSPRELFRKLSFRRKPSSRVGGRARASSEMNVHAAAGLVCPSQLQTSRGGKAVKPRWTSVLEISSRSSGRHRAKAGGTFLPPVVLNRGLAFSSDAPATFCFPEDGHFDLPPRQRAGHPGNGSRLSEVQATSAVSLNGDWAFPQLGDRWLHGSATLDSSDLPPHHFKLRRSRSFKELKKIVSRSFKSSRTAKY